MFSNLYKKIILITISFVVLGHFAIQANALEKMTSHIACESGIHTSECIKNIDLTVCNTIETDELQVTSYDFDFSNGFIFSPIEYKNKITLIRKHPQEERILISYSQLARSHLS